MKNIFIDLNCLHGDKVIISDENYHYLKNVRRIRKGNTLDAVIGDERYRLVVSKIDKKNLECDIVGVRNIRSINHVRIRVFQGLLKAKKMDFAVSKLSELGVEALFPLNTSRTVPVVDPGGSRAERWRKIAAEGSKISGVETIMRVNDPVDINSIRSEIKSEGLPVEGKQTLILFSTSYTDCHIKQLLDTLEFSKDMVFSLFFGPEGGFSNKEIKSILDINGIPVSMGDLVLRSETAAVVGAGFVRLYYSF